VHLSRFLKLDQIFLVAQGVIYVTVCAGLQTTDFVVGQLANDPSRRTAHQRSIGDHLAFRNERVGADQAVLANDGPVQHDGVDADQRTLANGTAMEHHLVADGYVGTDIERHAVVSVKDRAVLHIGVVADRDRVVVAAQDGAEPDVHVTSKPNIPDDGGVFGDPDSLLQLRCKFSEAVYRHIFSCFS
jgi:hypothetical protein